MGGVVISTDGWSKTVVFTLTAGGVWDIFDCVLANLLKQATERRVVRLQVS